MKFDIKKQLSTFHPPVPKRYVRAGFPLSNQGFTLIETLVAISILLLSIIGPMEIASKGLFSAFYARDEITAYYLAQEGVEYIRNARDTQYLADFESGNVQSGHWLYDAGIGDCIVTSAVDACQIDTINNTVDDCKLNPGANACKYLNYDKTNSTYSYTPTNGSTIVPSRFKRTITVKVFNNQGVEDEALISSKVSWKTGSLFGSAREFEIKERLFNWERK